MDISKAEALALDLMWQHGLEGWMFVWGRGVNLLGETCFYNDTIKLSRPMTQNRPEKDVTNTILHEIAHALAGATAGHGPEWKRIALSIGCDGKRQSDVPESQQVKAPLKLVCVKHNHLIRNAHRTSNVSNKLCARDRSALVFVVNV